MILFKILIINYFITLTINQIDGYCTLNKSTLNCFQFGEDDGGLLRFNEALYENYDKIVLNNNNITIIDSKSFLVQSDFIKELHLKSNKIIYVGSNLFKSYKYLQVLDLSFNHIQIIEKDAFKNMNHLVEIYLHGNFFNEIFIEYFQSPNLNYVSFNGNLICNNNTKEVMSFLKMKHIFTDSPDFCLNTTNVVSTDQCTNSIASTINSLTTLYKKNAKNAQDVITYQYDIIYLMLSTFYLIILSIIVLSCFKIVRICAEMAYNKCKLNKGLEKLKI